MTTIVSFVTLVLCGICVVYFQKVKLANLKIASLEEEIGDKAAVIASLQTHVNKLTDNIDALQHALHVIESAPAPVVATPGPAAKKAKKQDTSAKKKTSKKSA